MADEGQSLSSWIVLKIFAAFVVTLVGLGMLFGRSDMAMFLGAIFASVGLTYLTLLWIYSHRFVG
jgi:hypothetical protein